MEISDSEFTTKLVEFAQRNWKVKKLLEDVDYNFDKLTENIKKLIFKEFGITKVYTIKKYIIDKRAKE